MPRAILLLGATSPMARAAAARLARRGDHLFLASSDEAECERLARDLEIRYQATVHAGHFDATQSASHGRLLEIVASELGELDAVLVATGDMGSVPNTLDPQEAGRLIQVNFAGIASMLGACAQVLEQRGRGIILVITSVAGDRGRQSNFVYGAAKGGLALYVQGLRNLLHPRGVRVVTFKPGFVDTGMTYGRAGTFLVASPAAAGEAIVRCLERGSDVVYFPWFWWGIMAIIRMIPEAIFKRLKL
jgi:short-subunit dehydrogenase